MKFPVQYISFIIVVLASVAQGTPLQPTQGVDVHDWQIEFSSSSLIARRTNHKIVGQLEKREGDFSSWLFRTNPSNLNEGFEIILNEKTNIIFSFKPTLDAGGPFLKNASTDGNMIILDFGLVPHPRRFEIWDSSGHKLYADSYFDNALHWKQNELVYHFPIKRLDLNLNDKTRACRNVGVAWSIGQKRFSRKGIDTLGTEQIECSN